MTRPLYHNGHYNDMFYDEIGLRTDINLTLRSIIAILGHVYVITHEENTPPCLPKSFPP